MSIRPQTRFCATCGQPVTRRVPPGDNRMRDCCDHCGAIHYVNPRPVVGTVPVWSDKVLLCRRAIEPRYGLWTLPAGFMETGETTGEGAVRETLEEAGARVTLGPLFTLIDVPYVEQVHLFYLADLRDLDFKPGAESLELALVSEAEVPWSLLAFRTVSTTLRLFFEDRARGRFGMHVRAFTGTPPAAATPPAVAASPPAP